MKNVLKTLAVFVLLAGTLIVAAPPTYIVAATATYYPDADVETTSCDGFVIHTQSTSTWSTLVNGAGTGADSAGSTALIRITDELTAQYASLTRGILVFDTSGLPDGATVTGATLSLYGNAKLDQKSCTPNINIYSAAPASDTNLVAGDYDSLGSTAYSSAISYGDWSTAGYNNFTLNSTGYGVISTTGVSYFGVRNANYDVANVAPGIDSDGKQSYLSFYTADQGVGYKPKLVVTYYTIATPSITAKAASSVATTTARLNAQIADDGLEACEVRFGYGTTTQAAVDFADYDTLTEWGGSYTTGQNPYVDVSSLVTDTTYYYRVQAKNSAGTVTSTDEITFDTLASLNEPTNFNALPSATSVALSWVKGVGASTTLIRFSYTTYPTDETEGEELYSGAGSSYTHSGVASGTTIYYSAFGESGGSYSSSYATALVTTLAGTGGELIFDDIEEPSNWFLDVDYTTQSGMFYYGTINDIADNLDMPRNTVWSLSALIIAMAGGFLVYAPRQSLLGGGAVMLIVMAISSAMWLIPGWILFVTLLILGGFGILHQRGGI